MPELRQNPMTKDWVIIAPERNKRPDQFVRHKAQEKIRKQEREETAACPFCPGKEDICGEAVLTYYQQDSPGQGAKSTWSLRVVRNKFPALVEGEEKARITEGSGNFFIKMSGMGFHEVVIEHPGHFQTIATMPLEAVEGVISSYIERYRALIRRPNIELITIFRNNGPRAGTSIRHPHSQIIASPIVPIHIRHVVEEAVRYYDTMGTCIYCNMMDQEKVSGKRVISESEHFLVIAPFFSRSPFETWILPKKHRASFAKISTLEKRDLAGVLINILSRLYHGLDDPDYNYMIHSAPYQEDPADYYHWHVQILPKLYEVAGFELGSGIYLNSTCPEENAQYLKEIRADVSG
ncbi:MAG: galactose-1-phosphate uridylyltransferase [Deltaproteobacteria bacterium]|nr:MAG: galactose-1-phosphate uridylyltransferase [Deltaproteobacteria bacterium]